METYEIINFTYYDPANSLFKSNANDKSQYAVYRCCNKDNCDAYKRGKCYMMGGLFGNNCPYGKTEKVEGFTKRARKCCSFLREAKEKYGEHSYKLKDLNFTCRIGDYVYLGLPHLDNYVNPIEKDIFKYGLLIADYFSLELVEELIKYNPRALMGGVITSYQEKEIPKFIASIKRYFPDMYEKLSENAKNKLQLIDYKDKEAYVKTLLPCKVKFSIYTCEWDGEIIHVGGNCLGFWNLNHGEKITIIPTDETYAKIIDNDSVTDETLFVNM